MSLRRYRTREVAESVDLGKRLQHYVRPDLDQQEREYALERLLDFGYGAGY